MQVKLRGILFLCRSKNPEDWTEEERDAKMKLILTHYPPPTGKINGK